MNQGTVPLRFNLCSHLASRLVSGRVGIASEMQLRGNDAGSFYLSTATLKPARIAHAMPSHVLPNCGGIGWDDESAALSGLMELAERYCGAVGGVERARWGYAAGEGWLDSKSLGVFADWQYDEPGFRFRRLDADSRVRWLAGRSLRSGRQRHVPLAWVQIPFHPADAQEELFCSNSSGLAAGFSHEQAVASAVLELCERDAFMLMWHHRLSLPRLQLDIARILGARAVHQVEEEGATVHFVDLTNDLGVPVALCALLRNWEGGRQLAIGLAARSTIQEACRKAFFEAVGESVRQRQLRRLQHNGAAWQPAPDFSNVTDFDLHSLVYNIPEHQPKVEFIWAGLSRSPNDVPRLPQDTRALLRELLARVFPKCDDLIVVPMTTADIRALDIHVVKVLAPGLVSINSHHRYPHLGSRRIWSAAEAMGIAVDPAHRELPNRLPHPLA